MRPSCSADLSTSCPLRRSSWYGVSCSSASRSPIEINVIGNCSFTLGWVTASDSCRARRARIPSRSSGVVGEQGGQTVKGRSTVRAPLAPCSGALPSLVASSRATPLRAEAPTTTCGRVYTILVVS